jgi:hypothetical protein
MDMCSGISWQQFILTLLVLVVLYYLYVGIGYYCKDWWYRMRTRKAPTRAKRPAAAAMPAANGMAAPNPLLPMVHDLVDELGALLQGTGEGVDKVQLLDKLTALLQKYPALKATPFQPSINQLIAVESKNRCSIDLVADEIEGCWG